MTKPTQQKSGCSPWGLLGCGCGLLAMIGIALVFLVLGYQLMQERRDPRWNETAYTTCRQHMVHLAHVLESYQHDHHRLPARLEDLQPRYLDARDLRCPLHTRTSGEGFRYLPSATRPTDPLAVCRNHGQGDLILQRDGKVRLPKRLW